MAFKLMAKMFLFSFNQSNLRIIQFVSSIILFNYEIIVLEIECIYSLSCGPVKAMPEL